MESGANTGVQQSDSEQERSHETHADDAQMINTAVMCNVRSVPRTAQAQSPSSTESSEAIMYNRPVEVQNSVSVATQIHHKKGNPTEQSDASNTDFNGLQEQSHPRVSDINTKASLKLPKLEHHSQNECNQQVSACHLSDLGHNHHLHMIPEETPSSANRSPKEANSSVPQPPALVGSGMSASSREEQRQQYHDSSSSYIPSSDYISSTYSSERGTSTGTYNMMGYIADVEDIDSISMQSNLEEPSEVGSRTRDLQVDNRACDSEVENGTYDSDGENGTRDSEGESRTHDVADNRAEESKVESRKDDEPTHSDNDGALMELNSALCNALPHAQRPRTRTQPRYLLTESDEELYCAMIPLIEDPDTPDGGYAHVGNCPPTDCNLQPIGENRTFGLEAENGTHDSKVENQTHDSNRTYDSNVENRLRDSGVKSRACDSKVESRKDNEPAHSHRNGEIMELSSALCNALPHAQRPHTRAQPHLLLTESDEELYCAMIPLIEDPDTPDGGYVHVGNCSLTDCNLQPIGDDENVLDLDEGAHEVESINTHNTRPVQRRAQNDRELAELSLTLSCVIPQRPNAHRIRAGPCRGQVLAEADSDLYCALIQPIEDPDTPDGGYLYVGNCPPNKCNQQVV